MYDLVWRGRYFVIAKFWDNDIDESHESSVLAVGEVHLQMRQNARYLKPRQIESRRNYGVLHRKLNADLFHQVKLTELR